MIETGTRKAGQEAANLALTVSEQLDSLMDTVQRLLRAPLPPELESALLVIENRGLALRATVRNALIQARRFAPRSTIIDAGRVLARAVEQAEPRARESGVHVLVGTTHDLPRIVGDPVTLEYAFLLVLLCAVGATKGHDNGLQILAEDVTDAGVSSVRVTITDDRPGPPLGELPDLGTPGGGFGLDVARDVIVDHGGRFEFGPSASGGFVVAMTLPASAGDGDPA
jgi:signal transduction histidine kinase